MAERVKRDTLLERDLAAIFEDDESNDEQFDNLIVDLM